VKPQDGVHQYGPQIIIHAAATGRGRKVAVSDILAVYPYRISAGEGSTGATLLLRPNHYLEVDETQEEIEAKKRRALEIHEAAIPFELP